MGINMAKPDVWNGFPKSFTASTEETYQLAIKELKRRKVANTTPIELFDYESLLRRIPQRGDFFNNMVELKQNPDDEKPATDSQLYTITAKDILAQRIHRKPLFIADRLIKCVNVSYGDPVDPETKQFYNSEGSATVFSGCVIVKLKNRSEKTMCSKREKMNLYSDKLIR
jgi:hypothetical protein